MVKVNGMNALRQVIVTGTWLPLPSPTALTVNRAEVYAMIDHLTDVGRALPWATSAKLRDLYAELRLEMVYVAEERAMDVEIQAARLSAARVACFFRSRRPGRGAMPPRYRILEIYNFS